MAMQLEKERSEREELERRTIEMEKSRRAQIEIASQASGLLAGSDQIRANIDGVAGLRILTKVAAIANRSSRPISIRRTLNGECSGKDAMRRKGT